MCRQTTCRSCRKTTWAGCGQHVDQVMRNVPKAERCSCGGKGAATAPAGPSVGSRLKSFFGR